MKDGFGLGVANILYAVYRANLPETPILAV